MQAFAFNGILNKVSSGGMKLKTQILEINSKFSNVPLLGQVPYILKSNERAGFVLSGSYTMNELFRVIYFSASVWLYFIDSWRDYIKYI